MGEWGIVKPINIYELTRIRDLTDIQKLERQLSDRREYLKVKKWEFESLCVFMNRLEEKDIHSRSYNFYYSFVLPKLGKEFDLLRISDDCIINIELKSEAVSESAIKKQLMQNRYYLSMLEKPIYSYTYISNKNRLVRLSNTDKIVDTEWDILVDNLSRQDDIYDGNIEELFKEDKYIISPLTDPDRFLRKDYFLTSQQKDIENKILLHLKDNQYSVQGFSGSPGTGKSLLLYDIAMKLSNKDYVCLLHLGEAPLELVKLNSRLKRVDFWCVNVEMDTVNYVGENALVENAVPENDAVEKAVVEKAVVENAVLENDAVENAVVENAVPVNDAVEKAVVENNAENGIVNNGKGGGCIEEIDVDEIDLDKYSVICIDEAHRITKDILTRICTKAYSAKIPVIFSYATESVLLGTQKAELGSALIESIDSFEKYQLTNRIRVNSEISSFVHSIIAPNQHIHRDKYPSINIAYANNIQEAMVIINNYNLKGYTYIYDRRLHNEISSCQSVDVKSAVCKEFERVIMLIDESFYYNDSNLLVASNDSNETNTKIRCLYHGLSRAKEKVALVILDNMEVFERILGKLQK